MLKSSAVFWRSIARIQPKSKEKVTKRKIHTFLQVFFGISPCIWPNFHWSSKHVATCLPTFLSITKWGSPRPFLVLWWCEHMRWRQRKVPWFLMFGNKVSPSTYPLEFSFLQAGKNKKKTHCKIKRVNPCLRMKIYKRVKSISFRILRLKT